MARLSLLLWLLLYVFYNPYQAILANEKTRNGWSIRMIHRDSPDSPLYQPNTTSEQIMQRLVLLSDARVESFMSLTRSSYSSKFLNPQRDPFRPSIQDFGQFNYLVQVGIGTFENPPYYTKSYLVLDTGSSLIWTQCQGCNPCFAQRDPVFPRSISKTYVPSPCGKCPLGTACQQDHCTMRMAYATGTHVEGIVASETFTLGSHDGLFVRIPYMTFICVLRTQDFKPAIHSNNIVSGMLGMDRGRYSFATQIKAYTSGRFSYCLQPLDNQVSRPPMFLRFGDDIPILDIKQMHEARMLQGPFSFYYLDLHDLSVGSKWLALDSQVFRLKEDGTGGGTIIDAGTAISYIINPAYVILEAGIAEYIEARNQNLKRVASPVDKFHLCYVRTTLDQGELHFPTITFHFKYFAHFEIKPAAFITTLNHNSDQFYCLTIKPSKVMTILGAQQQVNHRIVFDTNKNTVQFAPDDCSISN